MKPRYKERIPLKCPVIFSTGTQIGEGRVIDLTNPGCLIDSAVVVQKEQSLQLKMFLPGLKSPLTVILGVVRWTNGKQFGVEFIKLDEANRLALHRVMAQHHSRLASTKRSQNAFSEPGGQNWHLETYSISKER
jgi:hypothetical protein